MPQRKCAAKRLRIDKKRNHYNVGVKSELKNAIKDLKRLIQQGKTAEAKEKIKSVFCKIDRAVSKGLLHKNTAARRKSGLASKLNKTA